MSDSDVPEVTLRYWAAARAAAGVEAEPGRGATVAEILDGACRAHPGLTRVVAAASVLLDGEAVGRTDGVPHGAVLDVLPPFAGG